ncbi:GNAT family N-acetyltransferase [Myroides odoratimimus]|uniref:GNAT family N-acetyltransferase n=1 Tax=Myroides odoratimimus TaxID=76832 RepID=UPI002574ED50|nr:GNAT family N-acetyltransferase [Myroides odoratimimus]MDM1521545.1 GNAT family N-acetyltransferase [Myroides odoratimimus]
MILFTTNNLKIETIQLGEDLNDLLKIHNSPDTMKWIPSRANHWDSDALRNKYAKNDLLYSQGLGIYKISLTHNSRTNIIGEILLLKYTDQEEKIEIGYIIYKDYWQKGYGTELLYGIELFIQQKYASKILIAQLYESNISSRKLLEKMNYSLIDRQELDNNTYKLLYQKEILSTL